MIKETKKTEKVTVQVDSKMSIGEKLMNIQNQLKIPRKQYNSFAKFYYRSCEDILEGMKPLLKSYRTVLVLNDEVVMIGSRFYVKATAILKNIDTVDMIEVTAFAREEETKKGMDGSQITGSSSSYARKYALSGLFGIDDSKDSDTTNAEPAKVKATISKEKLLTSDEMKAVAVFLQNIVAATTMEKLEAIGKEIKELKLSANQQAVLRESWSAKFQKLSVPTKK